jgi:hypothetical protein
MNIEKQGWLKPSPSNGIRANLKAMFLYDLS